MARGGNAAQDVNRDERLAGAGREAERGARLAAGELPEDGADRGVLAVAAGSLASLVRGEKRLGERGAQVDPDGVLVPGAEVGGRREFGHRPRQGVVVALRSSWSVHWWPFVAITNGTFRRFAGRW